MEIGKRLPEDLQRYIYDMLFLELKRSGNVAVIGKNVENIYDRKLSAKAYHNIMVSMKENKYCLHDKYGIVKVNLKTGAITSKY